MIRSRSRYRNKCYGGGGGGAGRVGVTYKKLSHGVWSLLSCSVAGRHLATMLVMQCCWQTFSHDASLSSSLASQTYCTKVGTRTSPGSHFIVIGLSITK